MLDWSNYSLPSNISVDGLEGYLLAALHAHGSILFMLYAGFVTCVLDGHHLVFSLGNFYQQN